MTEAELNALRALYDTAPTDTTRTMGETTITKNGTTTQTVGLVPKTPTVTKPITLAEAGAGLQPPPNLTGPSQGNLLAALRANFATGLRPTTNIRTFMGDIRMRGRNGKNPASLRIGLGTARRKREAINVRKQTNTLGLNTGPSVGLQI